MAVLEQSRQELIAAMQRPGAERALLGRTVVAPPAEAHPRAAEAAQDSKGRDARVRARGRRRRQKRRTLGDDAHLRAGQPARRSLTVVRRPSMADLRAEELDEHSYEMAGSDLASTLESIAVSHRPQGADRLAPSEISNPAAMRRLELPFRTLFRTPFVTIVAILSLGLGIGANAGIYSLFNEILLAPLPVAHPDRLVNFASPGPQVMYYNCGTAGDCDEAYDYPMFRDLERAAPKTAFSGIAGHMPFNVSLAMPGQTPITGDGVLVSGSYFPVLGIQPALGRLLDRTVDQPIEGNYVTVLSYAFWENALGANPAVLGKQITVNGQH